MPGSWTPVEGMLEVGNLHTATLLPDGRVLVAGGVIDGADSSAVSGAAQLYDPTDGSWTATGNLREGRAGHTATLLLDGSVLVAGGFAMNGSPTAAELYDPQTGRWTTTGNMIEARSEHTATLLRDGTVLVAGTLASAELYDPVGRTWTATGAVVEARLRPTATLLPNGTVLVAGGEISCGFECHSPLASAELYDPQTGSWTATGNMIEARSYHTATLLPNGTVLVAAGCCGLGYLEPLSTAELFAPDNGMWTAAPGMIEAHRLGQKATLLHDGSVLVVVPAQLYDPGRATWSATGNPVGRCGGETATLLADGRVLVLAGSSSCSGGLASAELYNPALTP